MWSFQLNGLVNRAWAASCLQRFRIALRTARPTRSVSAALKGHGSRACPSFRAVATKARRSSAQQVSDESAPPRKRAKGAARVLTDDLRATSKRLEEAKAAYYNGAMVMSDADFDALKRAYEARLADAQARGIDTDALHLGRALQVGAPIPSGARPCRHTPEHGGALLSLAAEHDEPGVRRWFKRSLAAHFAQRGADERAVEFVVEPKIDGLTLRASFRDGDLLEAATRGDGSVGEDVTAAAYHIRGLPVRVRGAAADDAAPPRFTVRGEVYISVDDFREMNVARAEAGLQPFANARNAAAGSLRLLDPREVAQRRLRFIAYELLFPPPDPSGPPEQQSNGGEPHDADAQHGAAQRQPQSQFDALRMLRGLGFATVDVPAVSVGLDAAIADVRVLQAQRAQAPYEMDGCVIKVNDLQTQREVGAVGSDPRWAVAWKFPALSAETELLDIDITVGRSGVIVPTAVLKPCNLGGVTVQRASLHNTGRVLQLGLRIGDVVCIERRGDVIPHVSAVLPSRADGPLWRPPERCPQCGSELVQRAPVAGNSGSIIQACVSPACSEQQLQKLRYFADTCIKGLGKETVRKLFDRRLVKTPADFYSLGVDDVLGLEGFGPKKAANTMKAIEDSKAGGEVALLTGMAIPSLGRRTAELLLGAFGSIQALLQQSSDTAAFEQINGIGAVTAGGLVRWFGAENNAHELAALAALWATERSRATDVEVGARDDRADAGAQSAHSPFAALQDVDLAGKRVVVSGSFPDPWTRERVKEWFESRGVKWQTSVSKSTQFLFTGASPGPSKLEKAAKFGVPIRDCSALDVPGPEQRIEEPAAAPSETPLAALEPAERREAPVVEQFATSGTFSKTLFGVDLRDIKRWSAASGVTIVSMPDQPQMLLVGNKAVARDVRAARDSGVPVWDVAAEGLPPFLLQLQSQMAAQKSKPSKPRARRTKA